jgi:hypothetical protein
MYLDAVVAIFAPALRIWTGHSTLLSGFVSAHTYAVAIEIIQGYLTTINVLGFDGSVLHTEQINFPFESMRTLADTLQGIPIFSMRQELQPEYRAKVVIESAKIILSVDWAEVSDTKQHLH